MTKAEVRDYILRHKYVNTEQWGKERERMVREVIADLSEEGKIFIPVDDGIFSHSYADVKTVPTPIVERFLWTLIKHMRSLYRKKIKPLRKYIKDAKLDALMGRLDEVLKEDEVDGISV